MDRIVNFLVSVQDNRKSLEIKHLLSNIILLIFFATLDPQVFSRSDTTVVKNSRKADLSSKIVFSFSKQLVAIDGKTIRGNGSDTQKDLHTVTAYSTDLGILYGQVATNEKSNEIIS